MFSHNRSRIEWAFLIGAVVFLGACSYGTRIERLSDTFYNPRVTNYEIAVTEYDYKEPYDEIAIVTTKAYDDRQVEVAGMSEMRRTARKLGGDAVVRLSRDGVVRNEIGYRPANLTNLGPVFVDKYVLRGVVVRFRRPETNASAVPVPIEPSQSAPVPIPDQPLPDVTPIPKP